MCAREMDKGTAADGESETEQDEMEREKRETGDMSKEPTAVASRCVHN